MSFETTDEEMERYCDLQYVWQCPQCGYQYRSSPGLNERCNCPTCNIPCEKAGESYMSPEGDIDEWFGR